VRLKSARPAADTERDAAVDPSRPLTPLRRLAALLAGGLLAAAALPAAAPAASARMAKWSDDSSLGGVFAHPLRDRMARERAHAASRHLRPVRISVPVRIYRTPAGEPVKVAVSPTFPDTPENQASVQSYVNFLAGRLHGSEIERLTSFLAPLREIQQICGPSAVGCYEPRRQALYVPAQNTPRGEYSKEFVATHEYGHHVALNRDNYPWRAIDFGPKRWSSLHRVCERVATRKLWPGDQGRHYFDDPGEGWAQAYGLYHYPRTIWKYNRLMRPVGPTNRAIRSDVLAPWSGASTWVVRGNLRGGSATRSFATPLDGLAVFRLTGPRGADFALEIVGGARRSRATSGPGSREVALGYVCGPSRATVRVRALRGGGRYTLVAKIP
jgi:hypothetical protein